MSTLIGVVVPPCAFQRPYSENGVTPLKNCDGCSNDEGNLICPMYRPFIVKNNGHGGEIHYISGQRELERVIVQLNQRPVNFKDNGETPQIHPEFAYG